MSYRMNIARPEKWFLMSSNQGAVDGCVGSSCGGPGVNIARAGYGMKGGYHYSPDFTNNPPMGPNGGLMNYTRGTNCGTENPLNLNASKQHSYASHHQTQNSQKGGSKQNVLPQTTARYGVENISQNEANILRGSYAPITAGSVSSCMVGGAKDDLCKGINKLKKAYTKEIENLGPKLTKKEKQNIDSILDIYTNAVCDVLQALNSTDVQYVEDKLLDLNSKFQEIKKIMDTFVKSSKNKEQKKEVKNIYKQIQTELIKGVKEYLKKLKQIQKKEKSKTKKNKKSNKTTTSKKKKADKNKRRMSIKKKRRQRKKTMKGGYYQYQSNVANTPSMSIPNGSGNGGMFANPPSFKVINNCHSGSYNHFTGKQKPMPVLDQDVSN